MALKPFSIVGEALQFSTRRFETVMRVSLTPLALLLIFNMAAAFGYLSVANERIITFKDVADAGVSWAQASRLAENVAVKGLSEASSEIFAIYLASLVVNVILVASFMAPLVRYAGLGEKPARGLLRVPFGLDQIRFILAGFLSLLVFLLVVYAPISFATLNVIGFISTAMTTPFAQFPDPASLHTIDVISGADAFGMRWIYQYQVWGAAAAGVAALLVFLFILHVRPKNEDKTAGIGLLGRSLGVVSGVAAFLALCLFLYVTLVRTLNGMLKSAGGQEIAGALSIDTLGLVLFASAALAFAGFFSLRLFPYAGVAVCRRSMAFNGAFKVTRRYDLLRLALAFVILGVVLFGAQILLVWLGGGAAFAVVGYLAAAVESTMRLTGGGEGGEWVFPFFGWLWAVIGIIFTLLWTAFTYGVTAGLWGRLYKDSAK